MEQVESASQGAQKLRVLVVEDHRDTAKCLAQLLRICGHEVALAHDGPEALKAAATRLPDVVLLDIVLPKMEGYEVARRLGAAYPDKRPFLIGMSGYGGADCRQQSAAAGIDLHLTKPVDPRNLRRILSQLVRDADGRVHYVSANGSA